MDEAETRRGVETVNARWGNLQAILAGDFLLARARRSPRRSAPKWPGCWPRTIGWLCEGQIEELRHAYDTSRRRTATSRRSMARRRRCSARRPHRGHRRRARPARDRRAHRIRERLRHRVPDRRRRARPDRHRRAARQAGRARPGGGRVHVARHPHLADGRSRGDELGDLLGKPLERPSATRRSPSCDRTTASRA